MISTNGKPGLIIEYEEILIGKKKAFSSEYMKKDASDSIYITLLQYVFRDLLEWDASAFQNRITMELINKLNLKRIVARISFPSELSPENDLFYLAALIYPDEVHYDREDYILKIYKEVLSGAKIKFPRNIFKDADGIVALKYCLLYALKEYLPYKSMKDIYVFFADSKKAGNFLNEVRLYSHIMNHYSYPIDFLHDTLPKTDESEFWYSFGRFSIEWNRKGRV